MPTNSTDQDFSTCNCFFVTILIIRIRTIPFSEA